MRVIAFCVPIFLGVVLAVPTARCATFDTSFRFRTIETEHFAVHFHQGLERLARRAAAVAESRFSEMSRDFLWTPKERIHIVLTDGSDFAGGTASVVPYSAIYINTVPPLQDRPIGEYGDWLELIVVHELAHVFTLEPVRGFWGAMRKVFGRPVPAADPLLFGAFVLTAPPNLMLPRWWHEGVATWAETHYTGYGRGGGSYYDMMLRMAVHDGRIPSIDGINGEVPSWPGGAAPYLFGMELFSHLAGRYGETTAGRLSIAHSGRFPFFLNGAPRRLLSGKNYPLLYEEMVDELKARQRRRIREIRARGLTPVSALPPDGEALLHPRFSPDGAQLAYTRRDPHEHDYVMVAGFDGANPRRAARLLPSDGAVSWSPDGERIYFSQAEIVAGFDVYQDLWSVEVASARTRRLTRGQRLKECDVSPDGRLFACVVTSRGSQNLALVRPGAGEGAAAEIERLTSFEFLRIDGPRFSPSGRAVAFSMRDNEGQSGLYLYDLASRTIARLVYGPHSYIHPAFTADGSYLLYSSDETGVYNIHAYSFERAERLQVTNVVGGAFYPEPSPDGTEIVFSSYDSRGFHLARMPYEPERWTESKGNGAPAAGRRHDGPGKGPEEAFAAGSRPYSPADTLAPRFWLPTVGFDHDGVLLGAFTAGADVVGYNTYMLRADYGEASGRLYHDFAYRNDYLYPTLFVRTSASPVRYSDFFGHGDFYELDRRAAFGAVVPVNFIESHWRIGAGYELRRQSALTGSHGRFDGINVFEGRRNNVFLFLEFNDALRYPYSISREEGRVIGLEYRRFSRAAGSDVDSTEVSGSLEQYVLAPFAPLRHHVIYLRLSGGAAFGERITQQAFQLGGDPGVSNFPLRGYPPRLETGDYIVTGTAEYRAPLWYILRGRNTKPFFWDRLHGAVFLDAGEVWDKKEGFSSARLKFGAGIEARLDMTLGYRLRITPAAGVARGLSAGGETRAYFTIYTLL
ncbi:MAG TPA: peptidase S9 [Deltaproteobacteria bacterium]|nr:peptidase S9 [Deltaproteobacteria bacterium]